MARPLKSNEPQFEPAFGPAGYHACYEPDSFAVDVLHARALQRRLADAFAPEGARAERFGLSPARRLGIIFGAASTLWTLIGASISVLMG